MLGWLAGLPIILVTFIMSSFCWLCTSIGASFVLFCQKISPKYMSAMLSFAGGVMIASSFFSLILPALEYCKDSQIQKSFFVVGGFILGGIFIVLSSLFFEKKLYKFKNKKIETLKRNILLSTAITLHNIPEGMAIGVALGSIAVLGDFSMFIPAIMLAVGIGIQNIPEGTSVSLPLFRDGVNAKKSFLVGVLSGIVEPIFACFACIFSIYVAPVLPLFLAFSAGAMMIVATTELIPESISHNKILSVFFVTLGFAIMSFLDIVFT
ncbi:MAG: ZIP family metal transporter [Clostridia bacterium]|nr:ZIP family metal transporter [Clostridia bacterium]